MILIRKNKLWQRLQHPFAWLQSWHGVLFIALATLSVLLLRSPWSNRMLSPNLEPFPDTFHYLRPVQNFITGDGFHMGREGRFLAPAVPPLYSISMFPVFLLGTDVRAFYLVNAVLSLASVIVFWSALKRINKEIPVWGGVILIALITHPAFYWFPELAMAENLLIFFVALGIYLSTLQVTAKTTLIFGVFPWVFYATKYAAAPTTAVFFFLFLAKIGFSSEFRALLWRQKVSRLAIYFLASVLVFLLLVFFEWQLKQEIPLQSFFFLLASWFPQLAGSLPGKEVNTDYFSLMNVAEHFPSYWQSFFGRKIPLLWEQHDVSSLPLGVLSMLGFIWALSRAQWRLLAIGGVSLLIVQSLFMSTFYVIDSRYVFHLIFFILLGFFFFGSWVYESLQKRNAVMWVYLFLTVLVLAIIGISRFTELKLQLIVNLKATKSPWYYLAVRNLDEVISPKVLAGEKLAVITPMSPYLLDFYMTAHPPLLPLSLVQDNNSEARRAAVWGTPANVEPTDLYRSYVDNGYVLYLTNYGLGNEKVMHAAYDLLEEEFTLVEIQEGCLETCNVYRVTEKEKWLILDSNQ